VRERVSFEPERPCIGDAGFKGLLLFSVSSPMQVLVHEPGPIIARGHDRRHVAIGAVDKDAFRTVSEETLECALAVAPAECKVSKFR
jgi:hypothetical protein